MSKMDRHQRRRQHEMGGITGIMVNPITVVKFVKKLPYNIKKLFSKLKRKK